MTYDASFSLVCYCALVCHVYLNLRFQARVDGSAVYARKFNFKDFPTSDGCKQAAIAYVKKTSQLLLEFDVRRGKAIANMC